MNSQTSTKYESRAKQKDSWQCRKHSAEKQNQNMHNAVPAISSRVISWKSLRLSRHRASNIRGRLNWVSCLKIIREGLPKLEEPYGGFTLLPWETLVEHYCVTRTEKCESSVRKKVLSLQGVTKTQTPKTHSFLSPNVLWSRNVHTQQPERSEIFIFSGWS